MTGLTDDSIVVQRIISWMDKHGDIGDQTYSYDQKGPHLMADSDI